MTSSRFQIVATTTLALFVPIAVSATGGPVRLLRQVTAAACLQVECVVELTRAVRVSDPAIAARLPTYSIFVAEDRNGEFLTVSRQRNQLVAFNASGDARLLGADPPGLRMLVNVVPAHASDERAYVFDGLSRMVLRLAFDGSLHQAFSVPAAPSFVLSDGRLIIAEQIRTPERIGYPAHLLDRTGALVRSFGMDVPEYREDLSRVTTRIAAPAADGSVWTIPPGRYVFEAWDPESGTRRRRVQVHSLWFTESLRDSGDPTVRPTDVIESAWEHDGALWTLIRVADEQWVAPIDPPRERALDPDDYDRRFDWMLEAIDAETGRVLASRRFDQAMWGRPSSSGLLASRIDGGSTPGIEVWRFGLRAK
jgi:hypothetical protein